MCFLSLLLPFQFWGQETERMQNRSQFCSGNLYLLTWTDVKHNWGLSAAPLHLPTSPGNTPISNPIETAGDVLCSTGCWVFPSKLFAPLALSVPKQGIRIKTHPRSEVSTRGQYHLRLLTVLQHQEESWLTPLVLQQIQGAWTYANPFRFKHPTKLQLMPRRKIALTLKTAKVGPRCSPSKELHLHIAPNTLFLRDTSVNNTCLVTAQLPTMWREFQPSPDNLGEAHPSQVRVIREWAELLIKHQLLDLTWSHLPSLNDLYSSNGFCEPNRWRGWTRTAGTQPREAQILMVDVEMKEFWLVLGLEGVKILV